jgi:hypothetical protein
MPCYWILRKSKIFLNTGLKDAPSILWWQKHMLLVIWVLNQEMSNLSELCNTQH